MLGALYLTFSDAAKYADVARNIISGHGFVSSFSFFDRAIIDNGTSGYFVNSSISPLQPYLLAIFFKIFGPYDQTVIVMSYLFFALTVIIGFLLAKKLFGKTVALVYSLLLLFSQQLILFAKTGASESLYSFEIILSLYLLSLKNRLAQLTAIIVLGLLYLTRPQAVVIIPFLLLYWILRHYSLKQTIVIISLGIMLAAVVDMLIIKSITGSSIFYPQFIRFIQASREYGPGIATSNPLRGGEYELLTNFQVVSKTFYNTYNFYRLMGQIMSPFMFAFFIFSLFVREKNKDIMALKVSMVLFVCAVFFTTALTIPLLRYLQPTITVIYLLAAYFIVVAVRKACTQTVSRVKFWQFRLTRSQTTAALAFIIVCMLYIGQTMGYLLLDSRFVADRVNKSKPPIVAVFAEKLKVNTHKGDIILTNLDTWGSWYGERTTVWYPLKPEQLISNKNDSLVFDYIYLTNYLIDDENYFMSDAWRQVLDIPEAIENTFLAKNYKLVEEFFIAPSENYERLEGYAVLLGKK